MITEVVNKPLLPESLLRCLEKLFSEKADSATADFYQSQPSLPDFSGRLILLVDDNDVNRMVAAAILKKSGLEVDLAVDGQDAIEKVTAAMDNRPYDAILMDVQMPIMGGYEATRILQQKYRNFAIPIIALTAHAMEGSMQKCLDAGMVDYISKPIQPHHLFDVLKKQMA